MSRALVAIGCNLGDRQEQLDAAVVRLRATPQIHVTSVSRWHETAPVGGPSGQGAFLNGALLLDTSLDPESLRQVLTQVESELGRLRDVRWQARLLDLDLLLYDQLVISTPDLVVPHPRMAFRRFVLEPAAEIAPSMLHPLIGWRIDALLEHLNDSRPYVALVGVPGVGKTELATQLAARFQGRAILLPPALIRRVEPSSSALQREIEFLQGMAGLLVQGNVSADDRLLVSDFWFGQTLAYAEQRLSASEFKEFCEVESLLAARTVRPRLRVLLCQNSAPAGLPAISNRELDVDRLQKDLCELAWQPRIGPLLQLPAGSEQNALAEILAAVEAMR